MSAKPEQLADGLWRWTARHPEWHPGEFGREVASFAAAAGDDLLLIDPLLPAEPRPVLDLIDGLIRGRVAILISIPYHVRSSEELWRRYRDRTDCTIWGHAACAKRLGDRTGFREIVKQGRPRVRCKCAEGDQDRGNTNPKECHKVQLRGNCSSRSSPARQLGGDGRGVAGILPPGVARVQDIFFPRNATAILR